MITHLNKITIILLLLGFSSVLPAKLEKTVESISVFGNHRASTAMIERVIPLKKGAAFSSDELKRCKKVLEQLGIFSRVEIETRESDGIIIIINVKEKTLFYISPSVRFNAGSDDLYFQNEEAEKSAYGVGFGMNDFSGRRQSFKLSLAAGKLNRVGLSYGKEYSFGLSWGASLANLWYTSAAFDGKVEKFRSRLFLGQRYSHLFLRLWGEYEHLKTKNNRLVLPGDFRNRYRYGLDLTYNSSRPVLFPFSGVRILAGVSQVMSGGKDKLYDRYNFQLSSFINVFKRSVLALDFRAILSDGYVPPDERVYFGGYRALRTSPIREYSGKQAVLFSCEYRVPLTGFSRHSSSSKMLGSTLYLFSDFGMIAEHAKELDLDNIKYNTGIGFIMALNKESILRLDVGVFPKFRVVLSTGWKF